MIRIGDKEYRNLEEQVLKNKEDIANHYNIDRVLADFGIRIIGTLEDSDELKDVPTPEQYGDAYAVGTEAPYDFYIWTRADANSGHPEDYWLGIGKLAIAGPQGPQGRTGDPGADGQRGSIWIARSGVPTDANSYLVGDQYLNTANGNIYTIKETSNGKAWVINGTIRGPRGISVEGPQGPKGDIGPQGEQGPQGVGAAIVQLVGIITNVEQLPDPETILTNNAYLQDVDGSWHLWVIVGQPGSYQWVDTGNMTVGSLITDNGIPLAEWDTKNALKGPYSIYWSERGPDIIDPNEIVSGLLFQDHNRILDTTAYSVRIPYVALGDVGVFGRLSPSIAEHDKWGKIGAIGTNLFAQMRVKNVPTGPVTGNAGGYLPLDYATPRVYVDSQIEFAAQEKISWPLEIPQIGMLLGINPDKSVTAIDPSTITGKPVKVECQIVKRGGSLVLPRDRMYLIRGYGDNTVTLKNDQGTTIAANFTMAFGAVSSSNVEISDPNKTWAGFMYISDKGGVIPSINWNGNSHKDVIVYNNDSGTSGSGNLYVYSIGQ